MRPALQSVDQIIILVLKTTLPTAFIYAGLVARQLACLALLTRLLTQISGAARHASG